MKRLRGHRLARRLLVAVLCLAPVQALGQETIGAVFASLTARWEKLTAYRCLYTLRSTPPGEEEESFTARYLFAKPSLVRMEIVEGKGQSTTVLWQGGEKARVRKGGVLSVLPLTLSLRNSLLLDPYGQDLRRTTWKYLFEEGSQALREGRLDVAGRDTWEGRRVLLLSNRYPPDREPFFRDLVSIEEATGWPLRVVRFDNSGRTLQETTYREIEADPPAPEHLFTEF